MVVELRNKYGDDVEIRTHEIRSHESNEMVVEGYASVFDSVYNIGFDETVDRGAFDNVLDDDVRFFFDHGGTPLARTTNGTLKLSIDDVGLHYRAELSDTTAGRDLFQAIKRGDVSQSSFAFTIDHESRDARGVRHIEAVSSLLDISAVSFPASPSTRVEARKKEIDTKTKPHKLRENRTQMELGKMNVSDLRAKRATLSDEFNALAAGIEAENRAATESESEQLDHLDGEISKLDGFIETREKQAKQAQTAARLANVGTTSRSERSEIHKINQRFSISRAIAQIANGRPLMGAELEWALEAQNEARGTALSVQGQIGIPSFAREQRAADSFVAGTETGFVPDNVGPGIDGLHTPSFTEQLGVRFFNATGKLSMPKVTSNAAVASKTEIEASGNATLGIGEIELDATRYTAKTTYSKQLVLQGSNDVDSFITRQIVNAHNRQIDIVAMAILTDAAAAKIGDATANGLAYVDPTSPGVLDEDIVFAMESALVASDTDFANVRFVAGSRGLQAIRDMSQTGVGGSAMFNGQTLMGYNLTKSGRVVEGSGVCTLIMSNFSQSLVGAMFGPLDVLVDPYSNAGNAQIVLHTNKWFDVALAQDGACAISTAASVA